MTAKIAHAEASKFADELRVWELEFHHFFIRAEIARNFDRSDLQYMVDILSGREDRLFEADVAEEKTVAVPKDAVRLLIAHFWRRPPNKLPLPKAEKAWRKKKCTKYREELDRRTAAGEPYKRVLHELSQKAAAEISMRKFSLMGPDIAITENTAKRYIQSPKREPGKKKNQA